MTERSRTLRRMTFSAVLAALLAVASPWTVPVGPVPVTLSILFLLLSGGLAGPRDGLLAVAVYVAVGALGVPVFSGFRGGYAVLIGPSGGFLLGYFPCVFLAGLGQKRPRLRPLFFAFGVLACYLFGAVQFGLVTGNDPIAVLRLAVLPFLLPDAGKIVAACLLLPPIERALPRLGYVGNKTRKDFPARMDRRKTLCYNTFVTSDKKGNDGMKQTVTQLIADLLAYGEKTGLCSPLDRVYLSNQLADKLAVTLDGGLPAPRDLPLPEILSGLCDHAAQNRLIPADTVTYRDLFDTALMGILTPRPSEVIARFESLAASDPVKATDWFYKLSCDANYIRRDRIARDVRWTVPSRYGEIELSINLSKPEKDPKAIAAAKLLPQSGYPKCLLCHENEGYAGNEGKPARQNLRQIPFDMDGARWYLQYSPYVYYNEHCIALSETHEPMKINRSTFAKLLGFVSRFPHYFIGSNADLPIVGGSILSHDHMQGGRHVFPMERAKIACDVLFNGYEQIACGIVDWPLSVIRLRSADKDAMIDLADKILKTWRVYSDPERTVFAETDGEPHNTITPIARVRGGEYELDLVLRNNLTTPEHPLGLYHPHEELHHIKKENIGLIEVMGLAVLPARLKAEMAKTAEAILAGKDLRADPVLAKHADWIDELKTRYTFTNENVNEILFREIGAVFVRVLEDAGVYPATPAGREGILRFVDAVNA